MTTQTDLESTKLESEGTKAAIAKCSGCEVVGDVEFVGTDFGPALQSKISQELLRHTDADAFIATYDAILVAGGAQALRASGMLDKLVVIGGECSPDVLEMIRSDSGADGCLGYDAKMEGWGAMNYLVNVFDGKDPSGIHNGLGWQAIDADHNLPPDGDSFAAPVDFVDVYDKLWSIE